MKRLSTLVLLILSLAIQSASARVVKGRVFSSADTTVVVGADCRLMSGDRQVNSWRSNADGSFAVASGDKGSLRLEVEKHGFSTTEILIKGGSDDVDLGPVFLEKSVELKEVSVTANQVVYTKGRTIVYPSASEVKASSTSIELFQKLPLAGLTVNPIHQTLSVDGGSPYILINGRPASMNEVNTLAPKDIEKIEFSRFTPARYADKGGNGFIDITLKKRDDGGNVYAYARSAVNTAFVDGNIRGSYHQGPSQFSLFYNPSWRNYQSVYDFKTESYISPDFRVNLRSHDRAPFNYLTNQMQLKYDYSPSLNTLFSATFYATPNSNSNRRLAHTADSELGDYDNLDKSHSKGFSPSLDLFFRRKFNDRNTLEAQVVGTLSSSDYRHDNTYIYPDDREEIYSTNADSRRRSLISEVSYIHTFSVKTELSAGFQNTISHSTNTYLDTDYKPVLTENNNYLYAGLGQSVGKFYFSLSSGLKMYWIKNDMNKRNFVRNLSRAQINWYINQKWRLFGSFVFSPSIPSLSALTDYPQQVSPYLVSNGNPDLKVSETFTYNLGASFNYKKFNATLITAYVNSKNSVIGDIAYLGDHLFLSQSVNARYYRQYAGRLMLQLNGVAGFGANITLNLNHYETAGSNWSHNLTSFSADFSLWWNKGPFTISYWRKIPGKSLYGYQVGKEENGDALQFQYRPDKHWNLGVSWMYMFDKKGTRYPAWSYSLVNPSYRDRYIKDNGNMVVLSATYTADFGSIFRTARRSLNNSDNGSSLLKQ